MIVCVEWAVLGCLSYVCLSRLSCLGFVRLSCVLAWVVPRVSCARGSRGSALRSLDYC